MRTERRDETVGKLNGTEDLRPGERILAAARRLFCRDGIHATGIDRILAEAGTAKMTLYNQFGSKEALVEAVLRRESEQWRSWLRVSLRSAGNTPRERLENLFPVLRQWFESEDYSGCAMMNAVAEYPKGDPRIHALAQEHKAGVGAILNELITDCGCARPEQLLNEMAILLDGAIIAALIAGDPSAADAAGRVARMVIASHLDV